MQYMLKKTIVRVEIFKEDDQYIAISPELSVSSFGDSPEEAKASLTEVIFLFLEECEQMGTLNGLIRAKLSPGAK